MVKPPSHPRTTSYVRNIKAELGTTFIKWTPIPLYSPRLPSSWATSRIVCHMPLYLKAPCRACSRMRVLATLYRKKEASEKNQRTVKVSSAKVQESSYNWCPSLNGVRNCGRTRTFVWICENRGTHLGRSRRPKVRHVRQLLGRRQAMRRASVVFLFQ